MLLLNCSTCGQWEPVPAGCVPWTCAHCSSHATRGRLGKSFPSLRPAVGLPPKGPAPGTGGGPMETKAACQLTSLVFAVHGELVTLQKHKSFPSKV